MGDSIAAPVIAGLAVGIAFVVLFSSFAYLLPIRNDSALGIDLARIGTVIVAIPKGAGDSQSGKSFEPQTITVVIGVNNTVRWINQDTTSYFIEADNDRYDPAFYQATEIPSNSNRIAAKDNVLAPKGQDYFEYTFTKAGEFGYHSKPWMRGTVIVLEGQ